MAVILSNIWFCRNQLRVSNKEHPISQALPISQQALVDFHHANSVQRSQTMASSSKRVAWIPPPDGCLKINLDGATFKEIEKVGLGVIIWNDRGQVLASLSKKIQLPFSFALVKAMAVARALSFATELGFSRFNLEGNSELVIKAFSIFIWSHSRFSQSHSRCQLFFLFPHS